MAKKMEEAKQKHPRLILRNFLTLFQCKELEFIHKSNSTVGYRPNVFSTTLSHLIATNSPHLLMPFVPIRESLKEKVEEFFGCEYELFVEFTGLISWCRGASIGWHSDDNRPYLKQRAFAITGGERLALTLWFSRDASHDEDAKLVSLLSQRLLHNNVPGPCLPLLASSNMYWFSLDQSSHRQLGFDICWARLHVLGFDVYSYQDTSCDSDLSELLTMPLQLARGVELFNVEFVNILHALQVAQFYSWKASAVHTSKVQIDHGKVGVLSQSQMEKINRLNSVLSKDHQQAEMFFSCMFSNESRQYMFDWADFASAVAAWEDYSSKLREEFLRSLPYWRTHQSIFEVPSNGSC
ncbi:hypothetical protein I3760_06G058200 [Carya illinoinensis]|nr:hypothetical protein I3760_06G058200 [Carya illinoinensis]